MSTKPRRTIIVPPKLSWESVLKDKAANRAFYLLTQRGASPEELKMLLEITVVEFFSARSYDMLMVEGLTREQLGGFPNRLRDVARTIQKVEENPHLGTLDSPREEVRILLEGLRHYADQLQSAIKFSREFMDKHPRYWDMRSIFQLKLLDYLKKTTGKPHYAAGSSLLTAALTSVGLDIIVDEQSLRKLYDRNRRSQKAYPGARPDTSAE
jgi:hypothetical protein